MNVVEVPCGLKGHKEVRGCAEIAMAEQRRAGHGSERFSDAEKESEGFRVACGSTLCVWSWTWRWWSGGDARENERHKEEWFCLAFVLFFPIWCWGEPRNSNMGFGSMAAVAPT